MPIRIKDGEFVDEHGRVLNLRGINLGGSSKLPSNGTSLDQPPSSTTFVNRPFPPDEAPLHFERLRACGFTLIRFIVTWEAIEHAGPGVYDTEYLRYVRGILEKAGDCGIKVYVDPHQDVWSRWTGGDGAPLWTLELAGFDVVNFRKTEAAICREAYGTGHSSAERRGESKLPKMIWPTNYFKLACATMFTLFWAGERFAPDFMVSDGGERVNIQTHLQSHYTNAMAELLKHLTGLDNVIGIGTMNEPSAGYVNVADLSAGFGQHGASSSAGGALELKYGLAPTPFQGMCLGEGHAQNVSEWSNGFMQHVLRRPDGTAKVDPSGKRAWKSEKGCVWKRAGVWRVHPETSEPELLRPDYFANVDFGAECYLPFARRYADAMRSAWGPSSQELLMFVELPPLEFSSTPFPKIPSSPTSKGGIPNAVNATHWYDGVTLFTRSWRSWFTYDTRSHTPVFGYPNVLRTHVSQLADIKRLGADRMDNAPTLIGECGIPYDMNDGRSYVGKNDGANADGIDSADARFGHQLAAMDHTIRCLERNNLSFTLWCYASDNNNRDGDTWNLEDLSVYSNDQRVGLDEKDPIWIYDGLRAARAFVRPYARRMAGRPIENGFDAQRGVFVYRGKSADGGAGEREGAPTEVFVPRLWCRSREDMRIRVSAGRCEVEEEDHCFVVKYWHSDPEAEQRLEIRGPGTGKPRSSFCRLPSFL